MSENENRVSLEQITADSKKEMAEENKEIDLFAEINEVEKDIVIEVVDAPTPENTVEPGANIATTQEETEKPVEKPKRRRRLREKVKVADPKTGKVEEVKATITIKTEQEPHTERLKVVEDEEIYTDTSDDLTEEEGRKKFLSEMKVYIHRTGWTTHSMSGKIVQLGYRNATKGAKGIFISYPRTDAEITLYQRANPILVYAIIFPGNFIHVVEVGFSRLDEGTEVEVEYRINKKGWPQFRVKSHIRY